MMPSSDPFQMCGQPLDTYKFVTTTAHAQSMMALNACGSIHGLYNDTANSGIKKEPLTPTTDYLQQEFQGKVPTRSCKRKIEFNPLEGLEECGTKTSKPTAKRNERERNRVRTVNSHFAKLREQVPTPLQGKVKKMSKVDILRAAMDYIQDLQGVLNDLDDNTDKNCNRIGSMSSNVQSIGQAQPYGHSEEIQNSYRVPEENNCRSMPLSCVPVEKLPGSVGASDIMVEIPPQSSVYLPSHTNSPHSSYNGSSSSTSSPHSTTSHHSHSDNYNNSPVGHYPQSLDYTFNSKYPSGHVGTDLLQMVTSTPGFQGHPSSYLQAGFTTGFTKEHIGQPHQPLLHHQNALFADDMFNL